MADVPAAQDEYDGYIWPIIRMLSADATKAEIARHLQDIETRRMGLSGNELRCEAAARQLTRFR